MRREGNPPFPLPIQYSYINKTWAVTPFIFIFNMSEPVRVRPLFLYEKILDSCLVGGYMKLNTLVEVHPHHVMHALRMAKSEHPFLRMSFDEGSKHFIERPGDHVSLNVLEQIPVIGSQPETWREKFLEIGRQKMDKTKTLYQATFSKHDSDNGASFSSSLFFFCNHSGTDGPSLLALCACILKNLNAVLASVRANLPWPPMPRSRPFCDVLSKIPKDAALLYPPPQLPQEFIPPVSPAEVPTFADEDKYYTRSQFVKLTREDTDRLISHCRRDGYSVQSALSVAAMMATLQHFHGASAARLRLLQGENGYPATFANQVPANMRSRIPLTQSNEGGVSEPQVEVTLSNEDCVCGSAAVWWVQKVIHSTTLKEAALTAYKGIHTAIEKGEPIGWLERINTGDFANIRPHTVMTSSVGLFPSYRNGTGEDLVEVTDFRFLGSVEEQSAKTSPGGGIMTHVYTFAGELHITFSYTSPHFTDSWGAAFVGEMRRTLGFYVGGDTDITVRDYLEKDVPL